MLFFIVMANSKSRDCGSRCHKLQLDQPIPLWLLTPRRQGHISHTYLWAGGFQQYRKSFKISQKPFYSQENVTLLSYHRKDLHIENKQLRWSIDLHPINAAVSSNLGMVSLPSLHCATLALLTKILL